MICDYFFPKVGGVESHIYSLAEALCKLGHKVRAQSRVVAFQTERESTQVIVITHSYPPRSGVRYLPLGLKVYYIPVQPLPPTHVHATLPGYFTALPYVRNILLREAIDVLHAHASLSAGGMEGIFHARTLGIKVVFTDHSLFGLGNMAEIWGNKMLKGCLSDVEAVICVSHTGYVTLSPWEAANADSSDCAGKRTLFYEERWILRSFTSSQTQSSRLILSPSSPSHRSPRFVSFCIPAHRPRLT